MICIQKICGFHRLNHQIIEKSGDVTPVKDGGGKWKIEQYSGRPETATTRVNDGQRKAMIGLWSDKIFTWKDLGLVGQLHVSTKTGQILNELLRTFCVFSSNSNVTPKRN